MNDDAEVGHKSHVSLMNTRNDATLWKWFIVDFHDLGGEASTAKKQTTIIKTKGEKS
jgi:hypothetical protein